jgi:hypothetical protein
LFFTGLADRATFAQRVEVAMATHGVVGWTAVEGMEQGRVLEALGLVEAPDARKPKASICILPNGWSVLLTIDFGFPTPDRMALLSANGTAIAVSADDRSMFSVVRAYERGKAVFAIEHDGGQQGTRHIETAGKLPAEWSAIFERTSREQEEEDQGAAEVDFMFDAPMELAAALCGYRHDKPWPEGPPWKMTPLTDKKGPGFLSRLFGG